MHIIPGENTAYMNTILLNDVTIAVNISDRITPIATGVNRQPHSVRHQQLFPLEGAAQAESLPISSTALFESFQARATYLRRQDQSR